MVTWVFKMEILIPSEEPDFENFFSRFEFFDYADNMEEFKYK